MSPIPLCSRAFLDFLPNDIHYLIKDYVTVANLPEKLLSRIAPRFRNLFGPKTQWDFSVTNDHSYLEVTIDEHNLSALSKDPNLPVICDRHDAISRGGCRRFLAFATRDFYAVRERGHTQ